MRAEAPQTPSLQTAIDQVATHGRALMAKRIDLLTLEGKEAVARAGRRLLETTVSILLGLCGFVLLSCGATMLLATWLTLPYACLTLGGIYLLGSLVLARRAATGAQGTPSAAKRGGTEDDAHVVH